MNVGDYNEDERARSGRNDQRPMGQLSGQAEMGQETTLIRGNLIEALQCLICRGIPKSPISVCVNGHSCCGSCRERMNSCGCCKGAFVAGRNFLVEDLLKSIAVACEFADRGCDQFVLLAEMDDHTSGCRFNPDPVPAEMQPFHLEDHPVMGPDFSDIEQGVQLANAILDWSSVLDDYSAELSMRPLFNDAFLAGQDDPVNVHVSVRVNGLWGDVEGSDWGQGETTMNNEAVVVAGRAEMQENHGAGSAQRTSRREDQGGRYSHNTANSTTNRVTHGRNAEASAHNYWGTQPPTPIRTPSYLWPSSSTSSSSNNSIRWASGNSSATGEQSIYQREPQRQQREPPRLQREPQRQQRESQLVQREPPVLQSERQMPVAHNYGVYHRSPGFTSMTPQGQAGPTGLGHVILPTFHLPSAFGIHRIVPPMFAPVEYRRHSVALPHQYHHQYMPGSPLRFDGGNGFRI